MGWTVEEKDIRRHLITFDDVDTACVLLRTDAHWDHPYCDRKLEKLHLDEAMERNAVIIDGGDLFCAMQGRDDPRRSNQIRKEHQGPYYFDKLVDDAGESYAPYASNIALMSPGNHEASVSKKHERNLTSDLAWRLRAKNGNAWPYVGAYNGIIGFRFNVSGKTYTIHMYRHHGWGGGGGTNKGAGQAHKMASYIHTPLTWTGHTHDQWIIRNKVIKVGSDLIMNQDTQVHVRTPGYKREFASGDSEFHDIGGREPKPVGAVWLTFYKCRSNHRNTILPHVEITKE